MKKSFLFILIFLLCFLLAACTSENSVTETAPSEDVPSSEADAVQEETDIGKEQSSLGTVTAGTEKYRDKVYGSGYSGGGETMSLVMGKRPDLFTAYLHVSSKWDGEYAPVAEYELPVYFAIGRSDEYYGSEPTQEAYETLYALYEQQGYGKEKIDKLLVLDIKEHDYFTEQGIANEHGGGGSFAFDEEIMGWLFAMQGNIDTSYL